MWCTSRCRLDRQPGNRQRPRSRRHTKSRTRLGIVGEVFVGLLQLDPNSYLRANPAFRHAAAPRWIGAVSVVLGGLTLVAGLSPLQYLAGFTGPVWLLVVALGFALGDRR